MNEAMVPMAVRTEALELDHLGMHDSIILINEADGLLTVFDITASDELHLYAELTTWRQDETGEYVLDEQAPTFGRLPHVGQLEAGTVRIEVPDYSNIANSSGPVWQVIEAEFPVIEHYNRPIVNTRNP